MQAMVARVLEQEKAVRQVLSNDRKTAHLIATWQDIEVLESINKALAPLADLTDIISGEDYVTVSVVKPLLHHISTKALAVENDDTELTRDIKERIKSCLTEKYSDNEVNMLLDIATVLDPRFKVGYISASDLAAVKERIIGEALNEDEVNILLQPQSQEDSVEVTDNDIDQSYQTSESQNEPPAKRRKLSRLLDKSRPKEVLSSGNENSSLSPKEKISRELERYLQTPQLDTDDNPLLWWKGNQQMFPVLALMAKKFLCICASSSASECTFSTSGNIVTSKRTCLKPAKINMLTFLSKNL